MSPSSPYNTVTVGSGCAVGKGRGWLIPASSLIMEIVARQSWYCVQSTMDGGGSWSWWMEPWTGIGTSRSWGIKCCHGRRGCLDVPRPIQHVTRQPFRTNRMLRSWTSQVRVQTWTQLSMFGIKCHSGSESMMTPPPPPPPGQEGCRPCSSACLVVSRLFWPLEAGTHATSIGVRRAISCSTNMWWIVSMCRIDL